MSPSDPTSRADHRAYRLSAIDMVRGLAIVIMAIDHVRDFFVVAKGYGVGLPGVYAVWLIVVVTLYPFCRWVAAIKARRRDWWLSYV